MPEGLTAAELVRRKRQASSERQKKRKRSDATDSSTTTTTTTNVDLDDEIARLEAELAKPDDDDDDSDSTSSTSSSDREEEEHEEETEVAHDGKDNHPSSSLSAGIVCLSSVKDERIERLPSQCLPAAPKRTKSGDVAAKSKASKSKNNDTQLPTLATKHNEGLQKAVQEVLSGYKPRSAERLPFYCRVCQKQYTNEAEFFAHRTTDFHKAAAQAEQKASFCKLCRKQFTSPAQMKEHLSSKPHKERLQRNPRRGRGNDRGGRGGRGQGNRQWT